MDKTISATDASRNFSQLLREVRAGQSYLVTERGTPVAKIIPANGHAGVKRRGRAALLARLRSQAVIDIGCWTRDELYEDEPPHGVITRAGG